VKNPMAQTSNISFWLHIKNVEREKALLVQSLFFRFSPEKSETKKNDSWKISFPRIIKKLARKKILKKNALQ
jgi:hypothetical protein